VDVSVREADFDAGAEIAALSAGDTEAGAVASFVGLVRGDGEVAAMTLEHYPGMTEQALADIVAQARTRWDLRRVRVIHRIGRLLPGDAQSSSSAWRRRIATTPSPPARSSWTT